MWTTSFCGRHRKDTKSCYSTVFVVNFEHILIHFFISIFISIFKIFISNFEQGISCVAVFFCWIQNFSFVIRDLAPITNIVLPSESYCSYLFSYLSYRSYLLYSCPFSNFSVFEAERFEEFSPLKNGPDSLKCSPISCRNDVYALHRKYLKDAGAVFISQDGDSAKLRWDSGLLGKML